MQSYRSRPLRIVQITDTHLCSKPGGRLGSVDVDRCLAAVLRAIAADPGWQPELLLLTGDLVQEVTSSAYERVAAALTSLAAPCFCLPGNHDDKALLAAACERTALRWEGTLTVGDWLLVFVDSVRPGEPGGHLSAAELERLQRVLGGHPAPHRLLLVHHQPVPIGSPWLDTMMIDNAGDLFAVLDRDPRLRGLIFGHVHQSFASCRRGLPIWGTPSTCLQFTPGATRSSYDPIPPGYRWLELHPDGKLLTGVRRVAPVPNAPSA